MLQKTVCKVCMERTRCVNGICYSEEMHPSFKLRPFARCYPSGELMATNDPSPWRDEDEVLWDRGNVHCPCIFLNEFIVEVKKEPPEWCPYSVEHFLEEHSS
jgi:hypothetical protein